MKSFNFKKNIITTSLLGALALVSNDSLASLILMAETSASTPLATPSADSDSGSTSVFSAAGSGGPFGFGEGFAFGYESGGEVDFAVSAFGVGIFDSFASFSFTDTITNTSGGDLDYFFGFSVPGGGLDIFGSVLPSTFGTTTTTVGYELSILLDGDSIFSSDLSITASNASPGSATLTTVGGNPIGGSLEFNTVTDSFFDVFYEISDYDDILSLGTLGDGDSFTLDYTLETFASTTGPASECHFFDGGEGGLDGGEGGDFVEGGPILEECLYADARIGDPASPFAVPEPGTIAMFGIALAGLAAARRSNTNSGK